MLEALFAADGPVSAEQLATGSGSTIASVYRNLETLEAHGVVRHVHLGHGPGLHALIGPGEHEYLFCEGCGDVRAVAPEELDPVRERIRERFGLDARFTHFPIAGLCARCAAAGSSPSHRRGGEHPQPRKPVAQSAASSISSRSAW